MTQNKRRHFLIYTTANETDFVVDYVNIKRMCKHHPGVVKVEVVFVVSEVDNEGQRDIIAIESLRRIVEASKWLEWRGVIYKSNIGRDFSSAQMGLREISKVASDQDVVMVRNRSAYGPFTDNWFSKYLTYFESDKSFGLIGNTINQSGHPDLEYAADDITCHIQTYLYLSSFAILKTIIEDFPGATEVDRLQLINNGELKLSREIMAKGFNIGCLQWPKFSFGDLFYYYPELPQGDIKYAVLGLPFEHRHSKIAYVNKRLKRKWRWIRTIYLLRMKFIPHSD